MTGALGFARIASSERFAARIGRAFTRAGQAMRGKLANMEMSGVPGALQQLGLAAVAERRSLGLSWDGRHHSELFKFQG